MAYEPVMGACILACNDKKGDRSVVMLRENNQN
jgi:hypothetical protein